MREIEQERRSRRTNFELTWSESRLRRRGIYFRWRPRSRKSCRSYSKQIKLTAHMRYFVLQKIDNIQIFGELTSCVREGIDCFKNEGKYVRLPSIKRKHSCHIFALIFLPVVGALCALLLFSSMVVFVSQRSSWNLTPGIACT